MLLQIHDINFYIIVRLIDMILKEQATYLCPEQFVLSKLKTLQAVYLHVVVGGDDMVTGT